MVIHISSYVQKKGVSLMSKMETANSSQPHFPKSKKRARRLGGMWKCLLRMPIEKSKMLGDGRPVNLSADNASDASSQPQLVGYCMESGCERSRNQRGSLKSMQCAVRDL